MSALDGKTAIITGAASGQGAAEARLFAAEGANVVLSDVDEANGRRVAAEIGGGALFLHHDISDESAWAEIARQTCDRFGGIDILVNNAAIVNWKGFDDTTAAEMRQLFEVNVMGAFFGVHAVVEAMRRAGGGSIVNVASISGIRGQSAQFGYGTSKWALRGMSKYMALSLAPSNIRVNCLIPGAIHTPMAAAGLPEGGWDAVSAMVPLKRIGTPEEVARLALFLASDASSYMTGADTVIDGGIYV